MTTDVYNAARLREVLLHLVAGVTTESALQNDIDALLRREENIGFEREVWLTKSDRIDFMVGRVGIEVKTNGSRAALLRQLHRYAQSYLVDELLVVTTVPRLASLPAEFNGKAITALVLSSCLI